MKLFDRGALNEGVKGREVLAWSPRVSIDEGLARLAEAARA